MMIAHKDTQFRVVGQGISTDWWEDTSSNRKAMVVFLRSLEDERGRRLFRHEELAKILGSSNRQASHEHIQGFEESGRDMGAFLERKRKVDREVVEAVEWELREDLWLSLEGLAERVNRSLGREDLTSSNMAVALDQLSGREIRGIFMRAVERGEAHYKESYVLDRLFRWALSGTEVKEVEEGVLSSLERGTEAIGEYNLGEEEEMREKDLQQKERFFESDEGVSKEELSLFWEGTLGWMLWAFVLYRQGLSMSVIGGWVGVHKSTVCRWLSQIASLGWSWVHAQKVSFCGRMAVDEKWVKIGKVWWYLFAAVDCVSGYPLHVALYQSNSGVYCKLFLLEVKRLGYLPKAVITDGWDGYICAIREVFPYAEHLLCRFHLIRSVFRRLRQARVWSEDVWHLTGSLFQSGDKRTVQRRVAKLRQLVEGLGVGSVVTGLLSKLPQVIGAVGSRRIPSTANAAEWFFRAFDRFYRIKGPFCDEASAQKHVQLFVLGYVFGIGARGQACPLEKAGKAVGEIPFYHLFNRPNVVSLRDQMVSQYRIAA